MSPEAANFLAKAYTDLDEARKIIAIGLSTAAARSAYYAGFHCAEALIFERTAKTVKTHSVVRSEYSRIAQETGPEVRQFTAFLAKANMYKEIGDYGVDPDAKVTMEDAQNAIDEAAQFLKTISRVLEYK